jgi:hypothetical protein
MLTTSEVRWFYPGEIPEAVRAWYMAGDGKPYVEAPRTDHYLIIEESDALGVKIREGRMDVKQRYDGAWSLTFNNSVAGRVECWRKWSFELAEAGEGLALLRASGAWVAVEKARVMRDYAVKLDGTLIVLPAMVTPPRGCSVELSRVRAAGHAWWSLCFEATGHADELAEILDVAARHVFRREPDFQFKPAYSYGYPRWLQVLFAGEGC